MIAGNIKYNADLGNYRKIAEYVDLSGGLETSGLKDLSKINNPQIVEFGVREGRSTKLFLDLCDQNNGKLFSVDIDDYSNLFYI